LAHDHQARPITEGAQSWQLNLQVIHTAWPLKPQLIMQAPVFGAPNQWQLFAVW